MTHRSFWRCAAMVVGLLLGVQVLAQTTRLANGGFESGTPTSTCDLSTCGSVGWSGTASGLVRTSQVYGVPAKDGQGLAYLYDNGQMSQSFTLPVSTKVTAAWSSTGDTTVTQRQVWGVVGTHQEYRITGNHQEWKVVGSHQECTFWFFGCLNWVTVNDYGWVTVDDYGWVTVNDYGWVTVQDYHGTATYTVRIYNSAGTLVADLGSFSTSRYGTWTAQSQQTSSALAAGTYSIRFSRTGGTDQTALFDSIGLFCEGLACEPPGPDHLEITANSATGVTCLPTALVEPAAPIKRLCSTASACSVRAWRASRPGRKGRAGAISLDAGG
ncbi:MAG: hypothetical protein C4K60_06310 [Ideonella sp. MAG2]|nr:MAG: hypothetical protein C4K60_06310 [Ideonella sp. MAG2]